MARDCIEAIGITDAGNLRQYNEDTIAVDAEGGIVAVADGMGGHRAGEIASRMAIESIVVGLRARGAETRSAAGQHPPLLAVEESINRANRRVFEKSRSNAAYEGMGTTLAMAFFDKKSVVLGHIGDSRIYRLRDDQLALLTRDDSLLRDQVDVGLIAAADASESHNRSLVTRALGVDARVAAHVRHEDTEAGDLFLLCSDGLSDLVEDADIELILACLKANLPLAAQHLVQAAKDNGGFDNVSVILARVGANGRAFAKLSSWLRRGNRN
jgi:protein phosphatase